MKPPLRFVLQSMQNLKLLGDGAAGGAPLGGAAVNDRFKLYGLIYIGFKEGGDRGEFFERELA